MSNEEILNKHIERYHSGVGSSLKNDHNYIVNDKVLQAMEEYKNQETQSLKESNRLLVEALKEILYAYNEVRKIHNEMKGFGYSENRISIKAKELIELNNKQ